MAKREARREREDEKDDLDERVIDITRVAKVVKGGRRFAFRTVVIVGDNKGNVGIGIGKSRGVPEAIRKGSEGARKKMVPITLTGTTIPHEVIAKHGGAIVMLRPASPGTGVIAGGSVRAVLEAVGIRDILSKSQGSNNMLNVAMATLKALEMLKSGDDIARMRGKDPATMVPFWQRTRRAMPVLPLNAPGAQASQPQQPSQPNNQQQSKLPRARPAQPVQPLNANAQAIANSQQQNQENQRPARPVMPAEALAAELPPAADTPGVSPVTLPPPESSPTENNDNA